MEKKAVVVHSGGMDSSLCLALAKEHHGADKIFSLSFTYGQRHSTELDAAKTICKEWGIDHAVINLDCFQQITSSALLDKNTSIQHETGKAPNTLVTGRNGIMALVAGVHAHSLGANEIYLGVIEVEEANSGYRDCSRKYMDIIQAVLRMDTGNPDFSVKTPIVYMTKEQTLNLGYQMGVLHFLLEETLTCYEGIKGYGCGTCPACKLRNEGLQQFLAKHPDFIFSYRNKFL